MTKGKEKKLMKPKLIWKGTLAEAEKHPLFELGRKETKKEELEFLEKELLYKFHKVINYDRILRERIKKIKEELK